MGAEIQQNYRPINGVRIVLSEEVYKRLAGCINLCGYNMGKDNSEFGTMLYGYRKGMDVIYFERPSYYDDYETQSGRFNISENMIGELADVMANHQEYNCVAHIHTHPYIKDEANRFLSDADVNYYKTIMNFRDTIEGRRIYGFGGMLSVAGDNTQDTDDISFVYPNPQTGELMLVPEISVEINGREIPLRKIRAQIRPNTGSQQPTTFNRTLFNVDDNYDDR
ncbi:MAG: hypothetical protein IJH12_05920 [Clostridia bacterium]|nr:hypothetical protein [Clostridia bacterium]